MTAADKLREKAQAHRAADHIGDLGVYVIPRVSHLNHADALELLADAWSVLHDEYAESVSPACLLMIQRIEEYAG